MSSPSTGKILAEVIVAGVNPADWKTREGYFEQMDEKVKLRFVSSMYQLQYDDENDYH